MTISVTVKRTLTALGATGLLAGAWLLYMLGGLMASPVEFKEPPDFVAAYAVDKYGPELPVLEGQTPEVLSKDYFNQAALVRNVIVDGRATDELVRQFTASDKATRVRIGIAFGMVNIILSHDEGTGFDEKREAFWEEVGQHSEAMQNAMFEALIASARERTRTFLPYTLAWWMQDDLKPRAVEMLAWAAKHHPDPWVRRFSVFYAVEFGENESIAADLLTDRIHDPDYKVRKEVFEQRIRRFKESLIGKEE